MADDGWTDWQPPQAAAPAPQDDGWRDWQQPQADAAPAQTATASSQPDDGWADWQAPLPPSPSDITQRVNEPTFRQQPQAPDTSRGIVERATEGFKGAYEPMLGDAVKKIAPEFSEQHPTASKIIQNVLGVSPIGMADKAMSAIMGVQGGAAGAAAGVAEKTGLVNRAEADRLQRDLTILTTQAPFESGMGLLGSTIHGRQLQIGDVGKAGLKDIRKQGQTPGPEAAAGTAQLPKPTADATATESAGIRAPTPGPEDYGKKTTVSGESGVNVGPDPTLQHALTTATETAKPAEAQVPPVRSDQVPTAEQAAAAQERIAARRQPVEPVPEGTHQLPEVTVGDPVPPVAEPPSVAEPPPVAALDPKLANRMLNQPAVLRAEAAKRGVTPDVLKAQAQEAVATPRAAEEPRPAPVISAEELGSEGAPGSLGAAATPSAALPTPPPRPSIISSIRAGYDKLLGTGKDFWRDVQMGTSPMATGTQTSMAMVKDHANLIRRIDYEHSIADTHLERRFNPEQRKRMWDAADEESVMRQRGEQNEHMGIATLTPEERAATDSFQPKARELWEHARQIGMVEGEGLPYYTPRMILKFAENEGGPRKLDQIRGEVQTTTPQLRRRKYMEAEDTEAAAQKALGAEAKIARDIRTMPLALAKFEKAIAGRTLIDRIKQVGRETGEQTVVEGHNPGKGWFTLDHPAFYTSRPRLEIADTPAYRGAVERHGVVQVPEAKIPLLDRNGSMVFDKVPIYVRGDFEGPLRSIMAKPDWLPYRALMELKGKTMSLVMNSPMIHNAVEWGRAMPAMPGKALTLRLYFEGNAAKRGVPYTGTIRHVRDYTTGKLEKVPRNASPVMVEAIENGLVPIGKRFFNQDLTSVMEQPNLTPGRSWTAQVLAAIPGLFDPRAGAAVKRSIDRAGDFWHNTLLWDRIGDLQMGLYVNAKADMMKKGIDAQSAARVAAHIANRYAGALPQEAMSSAARATANMALFSRSFTLGNIGVMKDMINGMPRDVRAQISRDIGVLDPKAANYIQNKAIRKAMMVVGLDVMLMYALNSVLQSASNVLSGDKTLGEEGQDYVRRFKDAMTRTGDSPLAFIESLSATYDNEPGKRERIRTGTTAGDQAVYARNPVGKIGEEFLGYLSPLDMLKRKLGTVVRPTWQVAANDKGFGQKIYDPHAEGIKGYMDSIYAVAKHFALAQTPEGQATAAYNLAKGEGDQKLNAMQAFGPLVGLTFSRGHPLGPAAGEEARLHEQLKFKQQQEMPEIRKLIKNDKIDEAIERMNELDIPAGLRKVLLNPQLGKRQIQEMYRFGTPEQKDRFERARDRQLGNSGPRAPVADWQDWKP